MHLLCYLYDSGKGVPLYPSVHPLTQLIFPESIHDARPRVDKDAALCSIWWEKAHQQPPLKLIAMMLISQNLVF